MATFNKFKDTTIYGKFQVSDFPSGTQANVIFDRNLSVGGDLTTTGNITATNLSFTGSLIVGALAATNSISLGSTNSIYTSPISWNHSSIEEGTNASGFNFYTTTPSYNFYPSSGGGQQPTTTISKLGVINTFSLTATNSLNANYVNVKYDVSCNAIKVKDITVNGNIYLNKNSSSSSNNKSFNYYTNIQNGTIQFQYNEMYFNDLPTAISNYNGFSLSSFAVTPTINFKNKFNFYSKGAATSLGLFGDKGYTMIESIDNIDVRDSFLGISSTGAVFGSYTTDYTSVYFKGNNGSNTSIINNVITTGDINCNNVTVNGNLVVNGIGSLVVSAITTPFISVKDINVNGNIITTGDISCNSLSIGGVNISTSSFSINSTSNLNVASVSATGDISCNTLHFNGKDLNTNFGLYALLAGNNIVTGNNIMTGSNQFNAGIVSPIINNSSNVNIQYNGINQVITTSTGVVVPNQLTAGSISCSLINGTNSPLSLQNLGVTQLRTTSNGIYLPNNLDISGNVNCTSTGGITSTNATITNLNVDSINATNANIGGSDITTALSLKSNLASPTFTGTPTAPTATTGTNTTQIATTAFVNNALTAFAPSSITTPSLNLNNIYVEKCLSSGIVATPCINNLLVT